MAKNKVFDELLESMQQMDEIVRGERAPSREFYVDAVKVKEVRAVTGLSQAKFAKVIDVQVGTLRNWEQGRRQPARPRPCCAPSRTTPSMCWKRSVHERGVHPSGRRKSPRKRAFSCRNVLRKQGFLGPSAFKGFRLKPARFDGNEWQSGAASQLGRFFRQNRITACAHSLGLRSLSLSASPVPSFQAAKACTL